MHPERDLIRGPKWRTRTTPRRRHIAAATTFAVVATVGAAMIAASGWLIARTGAPAWAALLPWWAPTLAAVVWALRRATPAVATDDDDDGWFGYSLRWVLVGEGSPRAAPIRVVTAVLFGGSVAWALLLIGALSLLGIV